MPITVQKCLHTSVLNHFSHVRLFATLWTVAHQAPLSVGILQARILEWVAMTSSRGSCQPGIKPRSPALQLDSLPSEPPGKPKNTRMGSLPLLQGIFPTQELNQGLLHCMWILYQLSYQGSPYLTYTKLKNIFLSHETTFRGKKVGRSKGFVKNCTLITI